MGLWLSALPLAASADEEKDTGLPVPRFVALKSGDVNMRVGPGTRYSINWVYKREGWPVEVVQEFEGWRKIRDHEGTEGWVFKQMLQGKRNAVIRGGTAVLRNAPAAHAAPVLRAEPGVMAQLLACEKDWCRLRIGTHKGWVKKTRLWGVLAKEEF